MCRVYKTHTPLRAASGHISVSILEERTDRFSVTTDVAVGAGDAKSRQIP